MSRVTYFFEITTDDEKIAINLEQIEAMTLTNDSLLIMLKSGERLKISNENDIYGKIMSKLKNLNMQAKS